ncbi:DUF1641 domain-containing protein [Peribacillus butanolivorans]|uniref:DUF1641 domain-containing protein n=1 Tax=Peribacillus TaxID=2675229 RepID=UPI002868BF48|nr:DUF1641 domain-containing protein [Peribacillus sp. R9-11]WMX58785.1 DUF1641 domain-containing protein [Peribacillus sp. R9-11]
MAKAIKQIKREFPSKEELQSQTVTEILTSLADNSEAIITLIKIVNQLHEIGVLKALNGLLENRIDVGEIAIQQINQPSMHNTIKNGMNAFKFIGSIPPDQLQTFMEGVSGGLEKSSSSINENEKSSLWKLGNSIRTPEVRQSLSTMIHFLEGMGEVFIQKRESDINKEEN